MNTIKPSPYILQWFGLATSLLLLGLALFLSIPERHDDPEESTGQSVLSSPVKHVPFTAPPRKLKVSSARAVWNFYDKIGFTMDNLAHGRVDVPRIYLASINNNWADNESVSFKKDLFYRTMLPLVLRVNEIISEERHHLHELIRKRRQSALNPAEAEWLRSLAIDYRVIDPSYRAELREHHITTLQRRIDIIPISMALGQAAYESGYATSRFAQEGNALFGQWRWGSGLMPSEQRSGMGDYRIADFATPLDSMAAFAKNLNTNKAYRQFREIRSRMRSRREPLSGYHLAAGLRNYSERGEIYVETLRQMIDHNNLSRLDSVKLGSGQPITLVPEW